MSWKDEGGGKGVRGAVGNAKEGAQLVHIHVYACKLYSNKLIIYTSSTKVPLLNIMDQQKAQ